MVAGKNLLQNNYMKKVSEIRLNLLRLIVRHPSELIESELFGHEKGSFTSAHKQKAGKFEQANGETLFDEIGDMSASAQAKVLRALQENKINRVGGNKQIKIKQNYSLPTKI